MYPQALACVALLLFVALPTASAEDEDALPPDCWFSTREHHVAGVATIHDTCVVPCPDHTCSSYPWDRDPWYYVPTLPTA